MTNLVVQVVIAADVPTIEVQAPAGTVPSGFKIALSDASVAAQLVTAAPYAATFAVQAGATYTATLQSVDQNGNGFGPVFTSNPVTVEADISVSVPNVTSITLALQ